MKKLTLILTLMVFSLFNLFAQEDLGKQPNLEVEGGFTYDWGNVKPEDSPLKAKIKIMNTGNADLNITKVKPGCGCTTAPLDKDVIKPGESTFLNISLKMENYTGDTRKTVMIESNDPNKKRQMLTLKFNVIRPYKVFPRFLSFNRMFLNQENSARIVINNNTDKPMKVKNIEVVPEGMKLSVKVGDVIPAKENLAVEAFYTPTTLDPFSGVVKIQVDNDEVEEPIVVRVWGRIVGDKPNKETH